MAIVSSLSEGGSATEGRRSSGLVVVLGFIRFLETIILQAWHDP